MSPLPHGRQKLLHHLFFLAVKNKKSLDPDGKKSINISRQIKSYKNNDPATKHQKCLPLSVFRHM